MRFLSSDDPRRLVNAVYRNRVFSVLVLVGIGLGLTTTVALAFDIKLVRWEPLYVRVRIEPSTAVPGLAAVASQAIQDWNAVNGHIRLVESLDADAPFIIMAPPGGGCQLGQVACAFGNPNLDSPTPAVLSKCTVFLNTNFSFSTNPSVSEVDLYTAVAHEMGHCLGLNHSPSTDSLMYSSYGWIPKTITDDDRFGLLARYSIFSDISQDGVINSIDWAQMVNNWNTTQNVCQSVGDLNNDCRVNSLDRSTLVANWGKRRPISADPSLSGAAGVGRQVSARSIATQATQPRLALVPSPGDFSPGSVFVVDVILDTGGVQTVGTDAVVLFDPAKLAVKAISLGGVYPDYPRQTVSVGRVEISGATLDPTGIAASGVLAQLTFAVLPNASLGSTGLSIEFDQTNKQKTTDANIVDRSSGSDVLDTVTDASIAIGAPCAGCGLAQSAWPMYLGGSRHAGVSREEGPGSPEPKWGALPSNFLQNSVSVGPDGTIYAAASDATGMGHVYALRPDGSVKWGLPLGNGKLFGAPAVGSNDTVYVTMYSASGGAVHSFFAISTSGTLRWSRDLGDLETSPTIGNNGTVYVKSKPYLYAFDANGSLLWRYRTGGDVASSRSSPAVDSSGTIYVGGEEGSDGFLYAIRRDGTLAWKFAAGYWVFGSSPAIGPDGTIHIRWADRLFAVRPDGTTKWTLAVPSVGSVLRQDPVVGADGTVYMTAYPGNQGYLVAIAPNGQLKWSSGAAFGTGQPTLGADGTIYLGNGGGSEGTQLIAFNPDGTEKWTIPARATNPTVIGPNARLYVSASGFGGFGAFGSSPPPPPTYTLSVTKMGSGNGTVSSSDGRINCGPTCSVSYANGAMVTLTAIPSNGSTFIGWSGACSGAGACQVTLDATKPVTATFQRLNVGVVVGPAPGVLPSGDRVLAATLTARLGCGPIDHIQFGNPGSPFSNAQVSITAPMGGPSNQVSGFTYMPPAGTSSVSLTIQRVAQVGGATVSPIRFYDGCGEWQTFVGGGSNAFQ